MLQQTTVATVTPRFSTWMAQFPDVKSLAAADERTVLRAWEGLGYYSRARHLFEAARRLVALHRGKVPSSYHELRALPGIGDYTACAILSIAYGQSFPVLDANVRRVGQRLLNEPEGTPRTERAVRDFLEERIPARGGRRNRGARRNEAGDFNEAMMELGALICVPRAPHCARCPVAEHCQARRHGTETMIPRKIIKKIQARSTRIAVIICRNHVWLQPAGARPIVDGGPAPIVAPPDRRAQPTRFLQGLWVFPPDITLTGSWKLCSPALALPAVTHAYMKVRERLLPILRRVIRRPRFKNVGLWVSLDAIDAFPMPSVYRRIARRALQEMHVTEREKSL